MLFDQKININNLLAFLDPFYFQNTGSSFWEFQNDPLFPDTASSVCDENSETMS